MALVQSTESKVALKQSNHSSSTILMEIIAPEYEFLFADVGMNGRNSDRGSWLSSPLKNAFETDQLGIHF